MSNFHDAAWAEKMRKQMPPVRYSMTVEDMIVFLRMNDSLQAVTAAYNYGFVRGCNFAKNEARRAKKQGGT